MLPGKDSRTEVQICAAELVSTGGGPELGGGQCQSEPKQFKLGSGHTVKGLMAASGVQCPGSEVDAPEEGCVAAGTSPPWE